ncbi:MAG: hypothetical protein NZL85_10295 [Fimbriimonadales bacterium]|nr:hypothetical protein [Fimbriimonadales bacterium]
MPRNKVMYVGVLVLAASVLLWLGAVLLRNIEWILPWSAGVGVALILIGMAMELRKGAQAKSSTAVVEQPAKPAGAGAQGEGDAQ